MLRPSDFNVSAAETVEGTSELLVLTGVGGRARVVKTTVSAFTSEFGGGATALDGLTDVVITTATSGDVIRHNGTNFVNTPGTTHYEVAGAVSTHSADTTSVHGITDTSALVVSSTLASYVLLAQAVNAQTGTTYTIVAGDAGKLVTLSNASAVTLTVPQDSDATIAVGTYVDLMQLGAGQVTVAAGTGATLRTSGLTAKARAQYSRLRVQKVAANTWSLSVDLAAS